MVSIRRRRLIAATGGGRSVIISRHLKKSNTYLHYVEGIGTSCKIPLPAPECSNGSGSLSEPEVKKRPYRRHRDLGSLRGVYYKNMKWQAAIKVGKKQVHLGTVACREDAANLYDRAAYICGREPNFELSEQVKQELDGLKWDDFLDITKKEIAHKKLQKRLEAQTKRIHGGKLSVELATEGY